MNLISYQAHLLQNGCNPGKIDGVFGPKTLAAYIKLMEKQRVDLPVYLIQAFNDLGIKERAGDADHPRILEYHKTTTLCASEDEVSWCSSAMNFWMKNGGHKYTGSALARSWLEYGHSPRIPKPGDIAIFARGAFPHGHVAFYLDGGDDWILHFGGNQSDAVTVAITDRKKVLDIRRP